MGKAGSPKSLGKMRSGQGVETGPTHIGELTPDPVNRRSHNPRNIGMVVDALQTVGAARSIVIDEDNVILAGNGVVEAAGEAGITRVRVVEADGQEIIAVRRTGLSAAQKRHLAIADNRGAELATWNVEQLAADLKNGEDLSAFFYEVPAERPTSIVAGDLFELGRHRLLCGDSTAQADVSRLLGHDKPFLMVTDPPYGVDYDPDWRNEAADKGLIAHAASRVGVVANDDRVDWSPAWDLSPASVCYCWHAGRHAAAVQASLECAKFELRCQIIWAKSRFAISRGHYHWQHEPCWYAVRKGATAEWAGDRSQTTLWSVTLDKNVEGGHSTQKPVELMARSIRNHNGDVYEPFCGSGTTLVASEQLDRRCFAVEIEPRYCQVIIDHWEAFTGQKAAKVGEAVCA
jgi:DNA modification methylase